MKFVVALMILWMAAFAKAQAPSASEWIAGDVTSKVIYHSPQTPGYSAWCTLWGEKNRQLRVAFQQVTGPVEDWKKRVNATVILGSDDQARTWKKIADVPARKANVGADGVYAAPGSSSFCGHPVAVLDDGTLVTGLWPAGDDKSGYVQRSSDDGKTWSAPIFIGVERSLKFYPTNIHKLRDGQLVMMGAAIQIKAGVEPTGADMLKVMFESTDGGKTWGEPIWIMKREDGVCEEQDFVELPGGDLLVVARCEHYEGTKFTYADRRQVIIKRVEGKWQPQPATKLPIPHSGFPELLATREGPILHVATDGVWWTGDGGANWTKLPGGPESPYYPRAMQLSDGRIIVIGHQGGDDVYGKVDQTIVQQTFRLQSAK